MGASSCRSPQTRPRSKVFRLTLVFLLGSLIGRLRNSETTRLAAAHPSCSHRYLPNCEFRSGDCWRSLVNAALDGNWRIFDYADCDLGARSWGRIVGADLIFRRLRPMRCRGKLEACCRRGCEASSWGFALSPRADEPFPLKHLERRM